MVVVDTSVKHHFAFGHFGMLQQKGVLHGTRFKDVDGKLDD
jgi:hypothetical protein